MADYSAPLRYRAHALETAACLWEAVLEMEAIGVAVSGTPEQEERGAMIRATREAIGSSGLRLTVIGWTDAVDATWQEADGCDELGTSGQYGGCFDWDFVPGWIVANVDWSSPHRPTCGRAPHKVPGV